MLHSFCGLVEVPRVFLSPTPSPTCDSLEYGLGLEPAPPILEQPATFAWERSQSSGGNGATIGRCHSIGSNPTSNCVDSVRVWRARVGSWTRHVTYLSSSEYPVPSISVILAQPYCICKGGGSMNCARENAHSCEAAWQLQ